MTPPEHCGSLRCAARRQCTPPACPCGCPPCDALAVAAGVRPAAVYGRPAPPGRVSAAAAATEAEPADPGAAAQ